MGFGGLIRWWVVFALFLCCCDGYKFIVGGNRGWVVNPSEEYNQWAGRNRFQVNDTLFFKYQKGVESVLVVGKDDYYSCNTEKPIMKMEDGESEFKFDRSGPFFFISGNKTSCDQGQKLIVVVLSPNHFRPRPPPASPPNPSAPSLPPTSPSLPPTSTPPVAYAPAPAKTPEVSPAPAHSTPSYAPAPANSPLSPPSVTPAYSPAPTTTPSSPTPAPYGSSPAVSPAPASPSLAPSPQIESPTASPPSPPASSPPAPGTSPPSTSTPATSPSSNSTSSPTNQKSPATVVAPSTVTLLLSVVIAVASISFF